MRILPFVLLAPGVAAAQSMEPRAYSNLPVGLNILLVGYGYSEGALGFDASVAAAGREHARALRTLGYVRSLDHVRERGQRGLVLPLVDLTGYGVAQRNDRSAARSERSRRSCACGWRSTFTARRR